MPTIPNVLLILISKIDICLVMCTVRRLSVCNRNGEFQLGQTSISIKAKLQKSRARVSITREQLSPLNY